MPSNLGYELSYLGTGGIIPLHPRTISEQIDGYNRFGQIFGPYQLTLLQTGWVNNTQTVVLSEVLSADILTCDKILRGTEDVMKIQDENYGLLESVESLDGQVQFTCIDEPSDDLTIQVSWIR